MLSLWAIQVSGIVVPDCSSLANRTLPGSPFRSLAQSYCVNLIRHSRTPHAQSARHAPHRNETLQQVNTVKGPIYVVAIC